jgi:hypothetical protein
MSFYTGGEKTCRLCGQCDLDVLTLDHVQNDGSFHRKAVFGPHGMAGSVGTGTRTYRWVIDNNYPEGFQVLCLNCNYKKHLEYQRQQRSLAYG